MHVQQHCIIRGHHDHVTQEAVSVDVGDPAVNCRQEIYQLVQWCLNRAVFDIETNNILNVGKLVLRRLTS